MRKGKKIMQFLQIKYPLPNRKEEESNNKDDTDNDITGRTTFMLDNSNVILKWIEFLELVSDEEFDRIINNNSKDK
ncbi:MAG: hypothetical protein ACR2F1_14115 [Nitrososphaeraceae archaeon]